MAERAVQPKAKAVKTVKVEKKDKKEAKLRIEIGSQPKTVDEWMKAKLKLPKIFTINEDGDLIAPPIAPGDAGETIIYLPPEEPTTAVEQKEFIEARVASIQDLETAYAQAKVHLHDTIVAYRNGQVSTHDVVEANNDVHQAECLLNSKMKGTRFIDVIENVMIRDLTHNDYDKMNNPLPVYKMLYSYFPVEMFWKKATLRESEPIQQVPTAMEQQQTVERQQQSVQTDEERQAARTGAIIAQRKRAMIP